MKIYSQIYKSKSVTIAFIINMIILFTYCYYWYNSIFPMLFLKDKSFAATFIVVLSLVVPVSLICFWLFGEVEEKE